MAATVTEKPQRNAAAAAAPQQPASLRDRILAVEDRPARMVRVPEWGVTIEVRTLSALERQEAMSRAVVVDGKRSKLDWPKFGIMMTLASCHDPETGERLFTIDDYDRFAGKAAIAVERLLEASNRLNGFGGDALESAEKN